MKILVLSVDPRGGCTLSEPIYSIWTVSQVKHNIFICSMFECECDNSNCSCWRRKTGESKTSLWQVGVTSGSCVPAIDGIDDAIFCARVGRALRKTADSKRIIIDYYIITGYQVSHAVMVYHGLQEKIADKTHWFEQTNVVIIRWHGKMVRNDIAVRWQERLHSRHGDSLRYSRKSI